MCAYQQTLAPGPIVCEHRTRDTFCPSTPRTDAPGTPVAFRSFIVPDAPAHRKSTSPPAASSEGGKPPAKKMVYETSAGGVVLRHIRGSWQVAIIEPNIINADTVSRRTKARPEGTAFA